MFSVALINVTDSTFLPTQISRSNSGFLIKSRIATTLAPGTSQLVPTGIALKIPGDQCIRIASISNLASNNIAILSDIIDSSDQTEVQVNLINLGATDFSINIGDNIGKLIFQRISIPDINIMDYSTLTS